MKRIIFTAPQGQHLEHLTEDQQNALWGAQFQYIAPMPGTISTNGSDILDSVAADDAFDPSLFATLGLDWTVIGMWQWDGVGDLVEVVPLDGDVLLGHLPDVVEYDADWNPVATHPPVLHVPHEWAGWPAVPLPP